MRFLAGPACPCYLIGLEDALPILLQQKKIKGHVKCAATAVQWGLHKPGINMPYERGEYF